MLNIGISDPELAESVRENLIELHMITGRQYQEIVKEALEESYANWRKILKGGES